MANEQGRYLGETIEAPIGADVGLGQVLYCKTVIVNNPEIDKKGVWFPVCADEINEIIIQPGESPKWTGSKQLGVAVIAASASPITATMSGTNTTILLNGYYSPGEMYIPTGASQSLPDGYFLSQPGAICGSPLYLTPGVIGYEGYATASGYGGFSCFQPTYFGATQGVYRVIGYAQDLNYPYVVRFAPDLTWIEF